MYITSIKSKQKVVLPLIIVAMIVLVLAGCASDQGAENDQTQMNSPTMVVSQRGTALTQESEASAYKNGEFTAIGEYTTPGGQEQVGVTLTLENGIVIEIELEQMGVAPTSKKMQADFAENFKPLVVGKPIDEVQLSKVSGSSLTSGGFNNALDQIRAEAQS